MSRLLSKKWAPFLLLAAATLLVWGHTVTFDFVWDDTFFIRDLPSVRSVKNIPKMFSSIEAQATDPYKFRVFRPIRTAHYALLHALDGHEVPQPWIFHLANILWHGSTAMMLFAALGRLLSKLRKDWSPEEARGWALFVALAFAVHPVVSEVVCWAKSLDDILAAFFTLASLRELLKQADDRPARWRGLIFFALAAYSKESAVPFAILPLVICRAIHRRPWRESLQHAAVYLLVAAVFMAQRGYIIERQSQTAPLSGTYAQTLLDMLPVVLKYFRLLWGVPPFFIDYKYLKGGYSPTSLEVAGGLGLLAALAAAGFFAWRRNALRAAGFGLLWTGLFLLPVSNLLPMMQYLAERFLYLPLIGWLLAAALLLSLIPQRRIMVAAALGLILVWGATAWNRSWIWKDSLTLFVSSSQDNPQAERMEHNAAAAVLGLPQIGRYYSWDENTDRLIIHDRVDTASKEKVLQTLEEAHRILPKNHILIELLGITLATTGDPARAVPLFEQAARLKPRNADYWLNLARGALATSQFEKARSAAGKAASLSPDNAIVLGVLFEVQRRRQDYAAARETVLHWRKISPTDENARLLADMEKKLAEKNPP